MNLPDAVKSCLNNYINFEGRATRSEYWWFFLFYLIVNILTMVLDALLGLGVLSTLATLALLAPSLAVGARRLHDIGKSGWWQLLWIVPIIGLIIFYLLAKKGDEGENRFGPATA